MFLSNLQIQRLATVREHKLFVGIHKKRAFNKTISLLCYTYPEDRDELVLTICNLFNLFISENGRIAFVTKEKDADERTKNNSSDGSAEILTRKFDLSCRSLSICNKMCYDKQSHNICAMLRNNMTLKRLNCIRPYQLPLRTEPTESFVLY